MLHCKCMHDHDDRDDNNQLQSIMPVVPSWETTLKLSTSPSRDHPSWACLKHRCQNILHNIVQSSEMGRGGMYTRKQAHKLTQAHTYMYVCMYVRPHFFNYLVLKSKCFESPSRRSGKKSKKSQILFLFCKSRLIMQWFRVGGQKKDRFSFLFHLMPVNASRRYNFNKKRQKSILAC